jgi:hypothetical protein
MNAAGYARPDGGEVWNRYTVDRLLKTKHVRMYLEAIALVVPAADQTSTAASDIDVRSRSDDAKITT